LELNLEPIIGAVGEVKVPLEFELLTVLYVKQYLRVFLQQLFLNLSYPIPYNSWVRIA
jgi:hypothetical protein